MTRTGTGEEIVADVIMIERDHHRGAEIIVRGLVTVQDQEIGMYFYYKNFIFGFLDSQSLQRLKNSNINQS